MSKYTELCKSMDAARGYMSDAVGKCQRDLRRVAGGKSRIDLYLAESDTYAAFQRREDLASRFDPSRAVPAFLVWEDESDLKRRVVPMTVSVDWASGVVRQRSDHAYGLLSDLRHALMTKDGNQQLVPMRDPRLATPSLI